MGELEGRLFADLSFFVPGYERHPTYPHRWDGKRYLIERMETGHRIPTGLVDRVWELLPEPRLVNDVPGLAPDPALASPLRVPFDMRPYQSAASVMLIRPGRSGRRGGVIQVCTGGGKTRIVANAIRLTRVPSLIIVNTRDLLHQFRDELRELLGCPIGQVGDNKISFEPIMVATIQRLARLLGIGKATAGQKELDRKLAEFMRTLPAIYFDEVQHLPADLPYAALGKCEQVRLVAGLSASPWRDDGCDLLIEAGCGPVVYKKSATELIAEGYLVAPLILTLRLPKAVIRGRQVWKDMYGETVVRNERRHDLTARLVRRELERGRCVLVLVKEIAHGESLYRRIPGAIFLQGRVPAWQRKDVLDAVRKEELRCVIATSLADEGLDLPPLDCLVLAGAGRSSTRALQRVGRVLRPSPGKVNAVVYDLVDGHPTFQAHYRARRKIWAAEPAFKITEHGLADWDSALPG